MLAAVLLLAISQILVLIEGPSPGYPAIAQASQVGGAMPPSLPLPGRAPRPEAYLIIALLGFAFWRDGIAEQAHFRRIGYWIALILVFAALSPGSPTKGPGAGLGGIAFLVAMVAAIWHQLLPSMVVSPLARRAPPDA